MAGSSLHPQPGGILPIPHWDSLTLGNLLPGAKRGQSSSTGGQPLHKSVHMTDKCFCPGQRTQSLFQRLLMRWPIYEQLPKVMVLGPGFQRGQGKGTRNTWCPRLGSSRPHSMDTPLAGDGHGKLGPQQTPPCPQSCSTRG